MFQIRADEKLVLASASPRRSELLTGLGLTFEVQSPDVDETQLSTESAEQMVQRLALLKAQAVAKSHRQAWVLAADTTVVVDQTVLGKPTDRADAQRMLQLIQGRTHHVWGGIALVNLDRQVQRHATYMSAVRIIALSADMIERYIDSGEPMDKAGSYAIQGIGAGIVESVVGSYTNVVGLNISAVISWLNELQIVT